MNIFLEIIRLSPVLIGIILLAVQICTLYAKEHNRKRFIIAGILLTLLLLASIVVSTRVLSLG